MNVDLNLLNKLYKNYNVQAKIIYPNSTESILYGRFDNILWSIEYDRKRYSEIFVKIETIDGKKCLFSDKL
jgi:hypothetical protein